MISQETIQQIQNRIDIIDVVGGFVKLKKRGTNYLGLCPFHNEKTPSFTVSPSKEIYKCFGCGRSGNAISFLMEHEKYSYVEALKWLAAKYQVEIEETETTPEKKQQILTADSLYIINSFAQKFFTEQLFETDEGKTIGLSYLKERGFREEIIKKFQLGYNPSAKDTLAQAALKNQFNKDLLIKSGLVVLRDEQLADNYRERIIFPVHNQSGKIVGFGARQIRKNDKSPKYINTPENEIYIKSKILYGSYFAKSAIDKADECLLVEGYTDVISLHQAGIENVVASGGTSLTPDQLRLIKKFTKNLTIIYDGDAAGIKAALRGLDLALEEGLNVKLVLIPDNEDPDSYVNKVGVGAFTDFIKNSKKDFILFQLEIALKDAGTDSNKKAVVVNQIAETISKLNRAEDFTKQEDYIKQCAAILKIDENGLLSLVNKFIREKIDKQEKKSNAVVQQNEIVDDEVKENESINLLFKDELQERNLVRSLIEFGLKPWNNNQRVADFILEEMDDVLTLMDNKKLVDVFELYRKWYKDDLEPTMKNFVYHNDTEISSMVVGLMEFPYELSENWKKKFDNKIINREELFKEDVNSSLQYLKLRKIKRLIEENQQDLEKPHSSEEMYTLVQTHLHLKQLEIEITKSLGTVILK